MSEKIQKDKIVSPLPGCQYEAIRSNADYVVLTGSGGGGKKFYIRICTNFISI